MINAEEARNRMPIKEDTYKFLEKKIENHISEAALNGNFEAVIPLSRIEYWSLKGHGDKGGGYEWVNKFKDTFWRLGYSFRIEDKLVCDGGYLIISWEE